MKNLFYTIHNKNILKTFLSFVAICFASQALADSSLSHSEERSRFAELSDSEAYVSRDYIKKIRGITLPGDSGALRPNNQLCINGDIIQSVRKTNTCDGWFVHLEEYDYTYEFPTFRSALARAELNGTGAPRCARPVFDHVTAPLVEVYEGCRQWVVQHENSTFVEKFTTRTQADNYIRTSERSTTGEPICLNRTVITARMPIQFKVEFYTDTNDSIKVGERFYLIPQCSHFQNGSIDDAQIIPASGELSGGSNK